MRKSTLLAAAVAALSIAGSAQAAATLVSEDFTSGLGVFTVSGQAGINTGNGYIPCCSTTGSVANMSNPFVAFGSNNLPSGSISTTVDVLAGETYTLTLDWGVLGDPSLSEALFVDFGPVTFFTTPKLANDDLDGTFQSFVAVVSGLAPQQVTLRIRSSGSLNVDTIVDNIVLTTSGERAAVPEPASWAMMLLGFAGIGMAARRRRGMAAAA